MNELALFAGIGGGILGSHLAGWRTVAAVELDAYCRSVLLRRQDEGHLPAFPIWDDVRTFDGRPFRGVVDLISAGFPCQPFSVAGKQAADDDPRNMWPDTIRVIREVQPRVCLLENVPGLLAGSHGYFGQILHDLAESGFDAVWRVLSAADVGAPHRRKRIWIVCYADCKSKPTIAFNEKTPGLSGVDASHTQVEPLRPGLRESGEGAERRGRSGDSGEPSPDSQCDGLEGVELPEGEQARRSRWRLFVILTKAKLEAIRAEASTMEIEFMPYLLTGNGQTVGALLGEQLEPLLEGGKLPLLGEGR